MSKEDKTKAAEDVFHWPPLESDPEIFTTYFRSIGMDKSWKMAEIFGLEPDLLAFIPRPALAVIAALDMKEARKKGDGKPGNMETAVDFYMKQTGSLDNACGVIAGIHAVLNNPAIALNKDSILANFKAHTETQTPAQRAKTLESANEFKQQHKTFAMQGQSNLATTQSDINHHFVAFAINDANELIEYDGTKDGPALIAKGVEKDGLLEAVGAEIKRRLDEKLITPQLSLMALCADQA